MADTTPPAGNRNTASLDDMAMRYTLIAMWLVEIALIVAACHTPDWYLGSALTFGVFVPVGTYHYVADILDERRHRKWMSNR